MQLHHCLKTIIVASALASAGLAAPPEATKRRPDLADVAQGTYHGDVISDSRGSSQSDVTIIVKKTGPSAVQVTSDYPRLPSFNIGLTRAMQTIQNVAGEEVFLLDLSKTPARLDIIVDEASWSGSRAEKQ